MSNKWQRAGQKVKPGLKIVGKLALLTALRYGPAGGEVRRPSTTEDVSGGGAGTAAVAPRQTLFPHGKIALSALTGVSDKQ